MKIIITMAGAGSRFRKAGYDVPKHEIVVKGKSLFEWSMLSLNEFYLFPFVFIVRDGFYKETFIQEKCEALGITEYYIHPITDLTDGQASTVLAADLYVQEEESILVYNIDTYVEQNHISLDAIQRDHDGLLYVFNAEGTHWSFIQVENERVIKVTEKIRISNLGSIGCYYFKRWGYYKDTLNQFRESIKREYNEAYIAPLYSYYIDAGKEIGYSIVNSQIIHPLGTPEEVEQFKMKDVL